MCHFVIADTNRKNGLIITNGKRTPEKEASHVDLGVLLIFTSTPSVPKKTTNIKLDVVHSIQICCNRICCMVCYRMREYRSVPTQNRTKKRRKENSSG